MSLENPTLSQSFPPASIPEPDLYLPYPGEGRRHDRWTVWHLVGALLLGGVGALATLDAWRDIWAFAWGNEEYSHIFLVPIVAGWLVWVRRARVRHCRPVGTLLGPVMVAFGWLLVALYQYYETLAPYVPFVREDSPVQAFWHGGAVLVVLGCMLSVLGRHALFRFSAAVAVLIFLVPVPGAVRQRVAMPLQEHLAAISYRLLDLVGVATEQTGNQLIINGQTVMIEEACNGLRMVFGLILVAYAFAFGMPLRNGVRLVILVLSPVAALVCNLVRILPLTWMYGYCTKKTADWAHDVSGFVMLPMAFGMLYLLIKLLRWAAIPVTRYPLASQG